MKRGKMSILKRLMNFHTSDGFTFFSYFIAVVEMQKLILNENSMHRSPSIIAQCKLSEHAKICLHFVQILSERSSPAPYETTSTNYPTSPLTTTHIISMPFLWLCALCAGVWNAFAVYTC